MTRIFSAIFIGCLTLTSFSSHVRAEEEKKPADPNLGNEKILRALGARLGPRSVGPVVYALFEAGKTEAPMEKGKDNQKKTSNGPPIRGNVQVSQGRDAAAQAVYGFLSQGKAGTRDFMYLKTFPPNQDVKAEAFRAQQQILIQQQLAFRAQQTKAMQAMVERMRNMKNNKGGKNNKGRKSSRKRKRR